MKRSHEDTRTGASVRQAPGEQALVTALRRRGMFGRMAAVAVLLLIILAQVYPDAASWLSMLLVAYLVFRAH